MWIYSHRKVLTFFVQLASLYILSQGQADNEQPTITNCPEDREPIPSRHLHQSTQRLEIPPRPTFTDNSGNPPNVTHNVPGEEEDLYDFEVGLTRIQYNATDAAGNVATCEYTVNVKLAPEQQLWNIAINDFNSSCVTLVWSQLNMAPLYTIKWVITNSSDTPSMESVADNGNIFAVLTVCGLLSGKEYEFEVESTTQGETYEITQRTKPMAPQDIATTNTSPTSISISWTYPDSSTIDQYHIFYHRDVNEGAVVDLGFIPMQESSYTFEGLRPSVTYIFVVEAVMGSGDKRTTNVASHVETTDAIPTETFIVVTNFTESTISVTWLDDDITDTILLYMSKTESESEILEFHPLIPTLPKYQRTGPMYEFIGLEASTEYRITIARNGENAVYKTVTRMTRPKPIHNLEVRDVVDDTSAISLSWDDDDDTGTYDIILSPSPKDESPIRTPKDEITISDLQSETDYYVQVVSVKDGVSSVPVRSLFRVGQNTNVMEPPCPESYFLVYMVAAGAGMLIFILLVVICGLLCLIPCEEAEPVPPLPPLPSYQISRTNTINPGDGPIPRDRPGSLEMTQQLKDLNGNSGDALCSGDSDYASMIGTMGTYKNMFGKTIKRRGYSSKYRSRTMPERNSSLHIESEVHGNNDVIGDEEDSASYDSVAAPQPDTRYPDSISHTSRAITQSFDELYHHVDNNVPV